MKCKKNYKDLAKYYEAKRRQQAKHRQKYGAFLPPKPWSDKEVSLLLNHKGLDRVLAQRLGRSLNSIYQKRSRLSKNLSKI